MTGDPLLELRDLRVAFRTPQGVVRALNGVDLTVDRGEVLGLVGETGSGKSVTGRAMLGLLDRNAEVSGQVLFEGVDLLRLDASRLRQIRGRDVTMVFQDARAALNPVFTVGDQLARVLTVHRDVSRREARRRVVEALERVDLGDPGRRARQYPHELSGGMCQRVMIAMSLLCEPKLVVMDEPTTGLDVTVQAGILNLIRQLVASTSIAVVFVTHDLGVVRSLCDNLAVMYGGGVMEHGAIEDLFTRPRHPYTAALQGVSLGIDDHDVAQGIRTISGTVPDPMRLPPGCPFGPRCAYHTAACDGQVPVTLLATGQRVACTRVGEISQQLAADYAVEAGHDR